MSADSLVTPPRRQTSEQTRYPGILRRHARGCDRSGRCDCGYQASVYSPREGRKIRKHFDSLAEARTWRQDVAGAVRQGRMRAPTSTTVKQAADELIAGMEDGTILDRSGKPFKPSTTRSYECSLRLRVLPKIGNERVSTLDRRDVQKLVDGWRKAGLSASTVQNQLNPLQVLCRRAVRSGELAIDPTDGLELPAIRGRRERIAGLDEAAALIAALPKDERALWATAFYAGLRRGEAMALRWSDVDLEAGVIHVRRAWDPKAGPIEVKSDAGRRRVPLIGELRRVIVEHKLAAGRESAALVFGRTAELPFIPSTVRARALAAWGAENERRVKDAEEGEDVVLLAPIKLHEARHCAASYLIAAGLNIKQISVYMGHSDVKTTLNIYGHLLPGDEVGAAAQVDAFFARSRASQG